MKVVELKQIVRKEHPLYYLRSFSAIATIDLYHKYTDRRVEFSIEINPYGKKEINVQLIEPVEYPIIPVIKALRHTIAELDDHGGLP